LRVQVGRTGRAGAAGRVTSLYSPAQAVLANALRSAIEAGEPVEGAFSRKRSFAKKLKRYGRYVPRGRTAEAAAAP
jgi:superfamily II DNA/RNA helicase